MKYNNTIAYVGMHVSACICRHARVGMHFVGMHCVGMHVSACMCRHACVGMHVSACMCRHATASVRQQVLRVWVVRHAFDVARVALVPVRRLPCEIAGRKMAGLRGPSGMKIEEFVEALARAHDSGSQPVFQGIVLGLQIESLLGITGVLCGIGAFLITTVERVQGHVIDHHGLYIVK